MDERTFADLDWQPLIAVKLPGAHCYDARELGLGRRIEWDQWEGWNVSVEEAECDFVQPEGTALFCHALNMRTDGDASCWVVSVADAIEFIRQYRPRT